VYDEIQMHITAHSDSKLDFATQERDNIWNKIPRARQLPNPLAMALKIWLST